MATASHSRWNTLSIWVGGPLIVLTGVAIWIAVGEFQASRRLQIEIASVKNDLRNTPLRQNPNALDDEARQKLDNFLVAINAVGNSWATSIGQDLPIIGEADITIELVPGADWDAESSVDAYLKRMAPAIAILRETPPPTQYPTFSANGVFFNRYYYWQCQTLMGAIQVLQLDLEYALRTDDKSRARADLDTIYSLVEAGEKLEFAQLYVWSYRFRTTATPAVRRTLTAGSMTLDELRDLRQFVDEPITADADWRNRTMAHAVFQIEMLNSEIDRAMLSDAPEYINIALTLPSLQEGLFNAADQLASIPVGDLQSMRSAAEKIAQEMEAVNEHAILPLPNGGLQSNLVNQLATKLLSKCELEEDRRFTLTAIAIKQFHLEHNKWPERLQDLSTVGLVPSDWQLLNGEQFGYQHSQDVSYLWGHTDPKTPRRISEVKPAAFGQPYAAGNSSLPIVEIR